VAGPIRQTGPMEIVADLVAPCPPDVLRPFVEDLGAYPRWLDIVTRAEPVEDPDGGAAWAVDLRGRLGPLARSKRLRMVRTVRDGRAVRFEREELDGRQHSPWVLAAVLDPDPAGCRLEMRLRYDGRLFGPVLERLLGDEIERSRARLLALVAEQGEGQDLGQGHGQGQDLGS